jgi:hypothetical protein
MNSLFKLKDQLKAKGEASDLFANPSQRGSLAGIFGNLDQSVFGEPAYLTIESKAAHLQSISVVMTSGESRQSCAG